MSSEDDVDREPFHPLGEAWQDDAEELLEETEYDAELGMQLAEDAMKVTKGELSETEFHDRYHEAVLEEFGEDERPIESGDSDGGRLNDALSRVGVDEDSRRDVMKKLGAGAGAVGLGAWGTADSDEGASLTLQDDDDESAEDGDGIQWGMALDLEVCDGCLSCVTACNQEHNWDEGANWMYILAYEDGIVESPEADDFESTRDFEYLIRPCQHCQDAPCEKVCPTTARHTREDGGLVLTDYDVCIGCRYCQVACPYGVNYFQWEEPDVPRDELDDDMVFDKRGRQVSSRGPRGVMEKCIFDPARQDGNMGEEMVGTTACEDACPPGAIQFGDMNDPESPPQQYLDDVPLARARENEPEESELQDAIAILEGEAEPADDDDDDGLTEDQARRLVQGEYGDGESTFRLLEEFGTNPSVVYIGNEPGPNAEQVPGPVAYEDVGQLDNRKEALDEQTVNSEWFTG